MRTCRRAPRRPAAIPGDGAAGWGYEPGGHRRYRRRGGRNRETGGGHCDRRSPMAWCLLDGHRGAAARCLAKRAAIMVGRYTHAHQFKRARRELKFLRIRLGRVIRDIRRKIAGNDALTERFADLLALAIRVRFQDHRQRGSKVYALHAPEVECIGKGKARTPYEFGCKVSIATPVTKPKGG